MIENITYENEIIAVIIRNSYNKPGITFCTPDDFSQQLAYMNHPKGKVIQPHVHNIVKREVLYTKEVLVIKKGKIKADFYSENKEYIISTVLESGDVILLASGGHGFEMLEDTEMYEIKQGPYAGENDKTRFDKPIIKEN
jgi:mannose-6-phosphate isomerase-like protein (cupin superfamily)